MAQITRTEAFKKHIFLLALTGAVVITVINSFGLSLVLSLISGDIMLKVPAELLTYFVSALNVCGLFLTYGALVNSLIRFGFKGSKSVLILCIVRIFLIYVSYLLIGVIVTSNFTASFGGNLYYCLVNGLIDLMLLCGSAALTLFLRSKYIYENNTNISVKGFFNFKNPLISVSVWVVVLISAFLLSGCIINTVADVTLYGASNLNPTEVIYLVTPYVEWLLKTAVGYVLMWCCAKWLDSRWKLLGKTESK